jgi:hypothetical protein
MKRHIGIDLGTTNCCVAWLDGETVVIYENELGHRTIPSIVAQERDGRLSVGWDAKLRQHPLYRFGFAKRALGSNQLYPMVSGPVHAYQISGEILKDLKRRAEEALGAEVDAVITIPAHFQHAQRLDTRRAAEHAGLEVIDLLTEPVAAAFAYYRSALADAREKETVLVYDLGGGTMDATVCVKDGERIEVAAHRTAFEGNRYLGGLDFDKALVGMAAAQLSKQGLTSLSLDSDLPTSSWLWRLMLSAEDCKHQLSKFPQAEWIEEIVDGERRAKLDMLVTRPLFERAISHLVESTLIISDEAVRKFARGLPEGRLLGDEPDALLRLGVACLDRILLVGGSTLVPAVQRQVEAHYRALRGGDVPVAVYRPFEAVAIGAALYAASRPVAIAAAQGDIIEWLSPLDETVPATTTAIHELVGKVKSAAIGSTIELHVAGQAYTAPVAADGVFRVQRVALLPGINHLAFVWRSASGQELGAQAHDISRGGVGLSPVGLGRPICIRTVQGVDELIPAGTLADTPCESKVYAVGDDSGTINVPLFEGVYPIGVFEFPTDAPRHTPVVFRCSHSSAGLKVRVQVSGRPDVERAFELQRSTYVGSRAALWDRFQAMKTEAARLINELPQWVPFVQSLREMFQVITMDIETEFANPLILDPGRIEDRLQQLQGVIWSTEAFPTTKEGFILSVEDVRRQIQKVNDTKCLEELETLKGELPEKPSPEIILALTLRLQEIRVLLFRRHPPQISQDHIEYYFKRISSQLESLKRDGGDEPILTQAEETLASIIDAPNMAMEERFFKLQWLSGEVEREYRKAVSQRQQRGLLSSAAVIA